MSHVAIFIMLGAILLVLTSVIAWGFWVFLSVRESSYRIRIRKDGDGDSSSSTSPNKAPFDAEIYVETYREKIRTKDGGGPK